jgi:hypothetical protein
MFMPSREKIENLLRSKDIEPAKLASDPKNVERAVNIVHGFIAIPWRWFVGKKRVRGAVMKVSERVSGR